MGNFNRWVPKPSVERERKDEKKRNERKRIKRKDGRGGASMEADRETK